MDDLEPFRQEIRAWLEANCPPAMRIPLRGEEDQAWGGRNPVWPHPDSKIWLERMADRGFTAPRWPREYGGGGLSAAEARVLQEELKALRCKPALASLGIWMLGPVILQYGTEAQKQTHLPPMARGQIRWCQGFSEPGAGSDLASLSARAVLDGDHYVINGQKVWTSHADRADWMFALVRTDPDASKHQGITFILLDMATPGISVRPIKLISGSSPFCETFFNDVCVPIANVLGRPGGGWEVARAVLNHERSLISDRADETKGDGSDDPVSLARRYCATETGPLPDPSIRDRIARLKLDDQAFRLTMRRSTEAIKAGRPPGPETSTFKLYGTELKKRRRELLLSLLGFQGLGWEGEGFTPAELEVARLWLRSRGNSIEGGSSEIQLNIIAKRVLGLPD